MTVDRYPLEEILWPDTPFDLQSSIVFACKRGSEAHGTYVPPTNPDSIDDRDVFALIVPPKSYYLGLPNWETATAIKDCWDVEMHELKKFFRLLLKQNPNVLSVLWMRPEDHLIRTEISDRLIASRSLFINKAQAYNSFSGYASGQIYKMRHGAFKGYMGEKRKKLVERFGFDCKNAAHAIRLLRMGIEFLRDGVLRPYRGDIDAKELVSIKTGEWSLDDIKVLADQLFVEAKDALANSKLPDEFDMQAIDKLLVELIEMKINTSAL